MECTEKLRHPLDERGIAWRRASNYSSESKDAKDEETIFVSNGLEWYAREFSDNYLLMRTAKFIITPKQAIETTLGRGECHDTGTFTSWRLFTCSNCRAQVELNAIHGAGHKIGGIPIKFCPNCGAKVVSE